MSKSCINCVWAEWEYTAHTPPRINKSRAGYCTYQIHDIPTHPAVISSEVAKFQKEANRKHAIWASNPHTDCLAWGEK